MKTKLLIQAAVITLISLACNMKHWQTVSEHGFTVTMPGVPKRSQETDPADCVTTYNYTIQFRNEAYTVASVEYPFAQTDEIVDAEAIFDGCRKRDLTGMNGTLIEDGAITLGGYAGRAFSIDSDEIRATVTYRMYWIRPRLYQLVYSRPKGVPLSADAKRFLDSFSFQLTSSGASKPGQRSESID